MRGIGAARRLIRCFIFCADLTAVPCNARTITGKKGIRARDIRYKNADDLSTAMRPSPCRSVRL